MVEQTEFGAPHLYGFINQLEYDVFCKLISVSKIGPKAGLGLLSSLSSEKLIWAIQNKQVSLLTYAAGIGKKTAERSVLDLKDKLTELNLSISDEVLGVTSLLIITEKLYVTKHLSATPITYTT